MAEWKLFGDEPPEFTTVGFFERAQWVAPEDQAGHAQRTAMVAALVEKVLAESELIVTWSDLGCGDGSLLAAVTAPVIRWGYDLGEANVGRAQAAGLDVRRADLLNDPLEFGDVVTACEVVEHLADPYEFLRGLPDATLIMSSPSAETAEWHYVHHAWAWDRDGYAALVQACGWRVLDHVECDGGVNEHGGVRAPQRFQAIVAEREGARR